MYGFVFKPVPDIRTHLGCALSLAILIFCSQAHGQTAPREVSISVHEAIAAAWNNDPVRTELQTNQQSADARAKAAQSWFAGGPTLSADYYDDRIGGSNLGYITWQGGVSVPLWLPGQGTATEKVAHADARTALMRLEVERMVMAVRVVEAAGNATLARKRETAALSTLAALQRISDAVSRAVRAGEAASVDSQAVMAQLADARTELENSREEIVTSRTTLQTLLGVEGIPDITQADRRWLVLTRANNLRWMEDDDPRVRAAHQEVIAAQEQVHLARASFMPNPEVGVDAIDQAQYGSPWDTQVGFNVRVPLPNAVTTTPVTSAARDRLAMASRQEIQARRAVQNEMAQVRARVETATATLNNARVSASAMLRRADAMEHSWRIGETPLIEALRARTDAYRSLLTLNQAEIAWHEAIIRIGIATGTMP